jgi:phosphonate transport system permease protein
LLALAAWLSGEIAIHDLFSARRGENLARFLTHDALPHALRDTGFSLSGLATWAGGIWSDRGLEAALATLWISVLSMVLAGIAALFAMPFATRTLITDEPYLVEESRGSARGIRWRLLSGSVRFVFVLLRALPEYVWAFLLLAILGPSAWPAVLALAIHNSGILGRLGADTLENLDRGPLRALRMLGTSRSQLAALALVPIALPRLLLYFFYRYETCVREATVLGMLGVVSLGYWIQDARARQHYDELLLLVAIGAALVIAGDLVSHSSRSWVRRQR